MAEIVMTDAWLELYCVPPNVRVQRTPKAVRWNAGLGGAAQPARCRLTVAHASCVKPALRAQTYLASVASAALRAARIS